METLRVQDAVKIPKRIVSISPRATLTEALETMQSHGVHHLVVAHDGADVRGVVSDRDIIGRCVVKQGQFVMSTASVEDIMHPVTHPLAETMTLEETVAAFREWHVSALPIVRAGQLVGIITESDVLQVFARLLNADLGEEATPWGQILLSHPVCQSTMRLLDTVGF